jgi:cytochrome P450
MLMGTAMSRIPAPDARLGWQLLRSLVQYGNILAPLEVIRQTLGDVFRLPLPGFNAIMLVGPEANRLLLTDSREEVRWRAEGDPVTRLLRHGLLVEDGPAHDAARQVIDPALHRRMFAQYVDAMWRDADEVTCEWQHGTRPDLVADMRRIALLILTDTLFAEDFRPWMGPLWHAIQRTIAYISPGPWLLWPGLPRPGYRQAIMRLTGYLDELVVRRRASGGTPDDLLGQLLAAGLGDDAIRDHLLTLFIAGHDTSTAQLAWALVLLAAHPEIQARARAEVDQVLSQVVGQGPPTLEQLKRLTYLDCVIKETLRLYPPIHLGSRIAVRDLAFRDYKIPTGSRVLYSIYLTHRDPAYWRDPAEFDPERFLPDHTPARPPYTYVPFGGGPRNCVGAAFAQVEAKVVLARILRGFELRPTGASWRPRMRATLEPTPARLVHVTRRLA